MTAFCDFWNDKACENTQSTVAYLFLYTVLTAFNGKTAFSGHIFAPLKNPRNAVAERFRKKTEKFVQNIFRSGKQNLVLY